jgi:site-specific recombinase XerD
MEALQLADITSQEVLDFLVHLETHRGNKAATRNCRLAALRCLARHVLRHDPAHAQQYSSILAIPAKKTQHHPPIYLEPEQFRLLLDQVDLSKPRGTRDGALLLFLYNTGARVNEALLATWHDVHLSRPGQVRLHGKGSRDRICPLWKQTTNLLRRLYGTSQAQPGDRLFLSARGQPMTRDGVAYLLRRYYQAARQRSSSFLPDLRIHPHTLRHSCAVALLQAGIELIAIRDFLGHRSVATTGCYLQTNMATKRETLNRFWSHAGLAPRPAGRWRPANRLLCFLESL